MEQLIYTRYKDLVKIDKEEIIKKVNKLDNDKRLTFAFRDPFEKIRENELINEIQLHNVRFKIQHIYSISDSSKLGEK